VIDILVPVLGRPHRAQPLADNIHAATMSKHRITFICTYDDTDELEAVLNTGEEIHVVDAGPGEYPRKINAGYHATSFEYDNLYPYVFNASDDLEFQLGWDHEAIRVRNQTQAMVIATNDQANSQVKKGMFGTHCLVTRAYLDMRGGSLDGSGFFLHEGYDHNFVDRELCHLAQHRGVYAYAQRSIVKHHHPLHDSHTRMDATYRKGLRNFHEDQLLFFQRAAEWNYEGLNPQERRVARNQLRKAKR